MPGVHLVAARRKVGDARTAGLVAYTSPDRPSLYVDGSPERAPWIGDEAVRQKGAVILWTVVKAETTAAEAVGV